MRKYYVLDIDKFKTEDVEGVGKHNTRDFRETKNKHSKYHNVDFSRTKNNLSFGPKKFKEFEEKLESIIRKDNPDQKIKTTTNVFIDFMISASPSYFFDDLNTEEKLKWWDNLDNKNPEDKKEIQKVWKSLNKNNFESWKKIVLEFAEQEEFKDVSLSLDIHMDEKTPHCHFSVVPKVGTKVDCKKFYTPATLAKWRAKLEIGFTPLGLERSKEVPGIKDDQEQHYKDLAGTQKPPAPPTIQPPAKMTSKDVFKVKQSWFGKKEKVQVVSTEDIIKNSFDREKAQGEKYNFYKTFYEENKYTALQVKKLENKYNKSQKENLKMKTQIKKLTDDQMENLRQIPLLEVIENLGLDAKKEGLDFYRVKNENLNLVINEATNQFAENKSSQNGFGAINLLVKIFGYSAKQAIEFLSGKFPAPQIAKTVLANPQLTTSLLNNTIQNINEEPPKPSIKHTSFVIDYLVNERGISKDIVDLYVKQNLIYSDNKKNLVIVNSNKTYGVVRGTVKLKDGVKNTFKCNKGKMDFIKFQNTEEPKNLYVFESAIDALAYQTLYPEAKGVFVSTNGNAMINQLLELHIGIYDNVFACFDNDDQGNKFTDKLKSLVSIRQKFEVHTPVNKDFAEDTEKLPVSTKNVEKLKFGKK